MRDAGGPETELPRWLLGKGVPAGIAVPIVPCGVFPRVEAEAWAQESGGHPRAGGAAKEIQELPGSN